MFWLTLRFPTFLSHILKRFKVLDDEIFMFFSSSILSRSLVVNFPMEKYMFYFSDM